MFRPFWTVLGRFAQSEIVTIPPPPPPPNFLLVRIGQFYVAWGDNNKLWHIICLGGGGGGATNSSTEKQKPDQLNVWKVFISNEAIQYPSFAQLLMIMIATPCNTFDLERGYTFLEMVASKRTTALKPENVEILFLLAALKIPVKLVDDYYKKWIT